MVAVYKFNFLAVSCGQPRLRNGNIVGDSFDFQDRVACFCDSGYELQGTTFSTCLATGTWSGPTPECKCLFSECWHFFLVWYSIL